MDADCNYHIDDIVLREGTVGLPVPHRTNGSAGISIAADYPSFRVSFRSELKIGYCTPLASRRIALFYAAPPDR